MDLATQVHLNLIVQLESRMRDLEASMYCTYSDMVEKKPEVERGSQHNWLFNAMLKATEKNHCCSARQAVKAG